MVCRIQCRWYVLCVPQRYWVNTLSASPLISNRDFAAGQISDIAEKLEQAEGQLAHGARMGGYGQLT